MCDSSSKLPTKGDNEDSANTRSRRGYLAINSFRKYFWRNRKPHQNKNQHKFKFGIPHTCNKHQLTERDKNEEQVVTLYPTETTDRVNTTTNQQEEVERCPELQDTHTEDSKAKVDDDSATNKERSEYETNDIYPRDLILHGNDTYGHDKPYISGDSYSINQESGNEGKQECSHLVKDEFLMSDQSEGDNYKDQYNGFLFKAKSKILHLIYLIKPYIRKKWVVILVVITLIAIFLVGLAVFCSVTYCYFINVTSCYINKESFSEFVAYKLKTPSKIFGCEIKKGITEFEKMFKTFTDYFSDHEKLFC